MADDRIRSVERRYRETGSLVDEVAYLTARLRRGDLDLEQLELAAHFGRAAALEVLHREGIPLEGEPWSWLSELERWGKEPGVRAAVAAARACPVLEPPLDETLRLVEDWLRCPCDAHAQRCRRQDLPALAEVGEVRGHTHVLRPGELWFSQTEGHTHGRVLPGARASEEGGPPPHTHPLPPAFLAVTTAWNLRNAVLAHGGFTAALQAAHLAERLGLTPAEIGRELVPWALGYGEA